MGRPEFVRHVAVAAVVLASPTIARTQTADSFEVASVKRAHDTSADPNLDSVRGRLTATNVSVGYLIRFSFALKDYQIERLPGWAENERYDIAAKGAADEPSDKAAALAQEQARVRQLLAERFGLTAHRETKQMPVYLLVEAKGGARLTAHNDGTGSGTRNACGHLTGKRLTLDTVATVLSRELGREVLNQIALPGKYDFQLDWTPDAGPCPGVDGARVLPFIFTAIQEQLGLKLESGKGAVQVLIIDRLERASDN
jgi:uncharacterized protein (TIGR03435 family)